MGAYELGSDSRKVPMVANPRRRLLAARGDLRYAEEPVMIPARGKSPAGSASAQVHRAISAQANRTLGDDGQLGDLGFSFKSIGNVLKKVASPVATVAANFIPGGHIIQKVAQTGIAALSHQSKPAPAPPPAPTPVAHWLKKPAPVNPPPSTGGGFISNRVLAQIADMKAKAEARGERPQTIAPGPAQIHKLAPDAVLRPGTAKPAAVTEKETGLLATLKREVEALKAGASTADKARDTASKANDLSKKLDARAQRAASNARQLAEKLKQLSEAGDAVGASKVSAQLAQLQEVVTNTANLAQQAGSIVSRAGSGIEAGTNAAIAAAATDSPAVGGLVAWTQRNPALAIGAGAGLAFLTYKALKK